jgi:hypothetical protein
MGRMSRVGRVGRVARAGGGVFTPLSVANLELWLDASDAATLFQDSAGTTAATANNDPVGRWSDKSGNGRNATQGTAGARPLLKTALQNGRAMLRTDGTDDVLSLPDFLTGFTAGEIFAVVKSVNAKGSRQDGLWTFSVPDSGYYTFTDSQVYDGFGTDTRKTVGAISGDTNIARVINVYSAANDWAFRLDNTEVFSTGTNTVSFRADPSIGSNAGAPQFGNHDWGEVVLYSRKLTTAERSAVTAYLAAKWGTP